MIFHGIVVTLVPFRSPIPAVMTPPGRRDHQPSSGRKTWNYHACATATMVAHRQNGSRSRAWFIAVLRPMVREAQCRLHPATINSAHGVSLIDFQNINRGHHQMQADERTFGDIFALLIKGTGVEERDTDNRCTRAQTIYCYLIPTAVTFFVFYALIPSYPNPDPCHKLMGDGPPCLTTNGQQPLSQN